jgi:hypothetical protein
VSICAISGLFILPQMTQIFTDWGDLQACLFFKSEPPMRPKASAFDRNE